MGIDYQMMGKRVKALRKSKKLTQEMLAEKSDITVQYLSNIERSHSIPSLETLMSLCRSLNVTPNDVLIGVDISSEEYLVPDIMSRIKQCSPSEKRLLHGFLDLLEKERSIEN